MKKFFLVFAVFLTLCFAASVNASPEIVITGGYKSRTKDTARVLKLYSFAMKELKYDQDIRSLHIHFLYAPLPWMKKFDLTSVCVREAYNDNVIYALRDIPDEILIHEITHAILSEKSMDILNSKCQEVLAGYVEYEYRKMSR